MEVHLAQKRFVAGIGFEISHAGKRFHIDQRGIMLPVGTLEPGKRAIKVFAARIQIRDLGGCSRGIFLLDHHHAPIGLTIAPQRIECERSEELAIQVIGLLVDLGERRRRLTASQQRQAKNAVQPGARRINSTALRAACSASGSLAPLLRFTPTA